MEREAGHMQSASALVILQHLKEDCNDCNIDAVPATEKGEEDRDKASAASEATLACHDREISKQRWLLSALHNMETVCDVREDLPKPTQQHVGRKILALFENQGWSLVHCSTLPQNSMVLTILFYLKGTTSYLAVTNSNAAIFHLSPEPLNHKAYPNVHPMLCPIISASTLAFAPGTFSSVSCVSLVSILPSSDVPKMLHNINRVLTPGGLLHMILIDPCPRASSMGPLLRDWLDQHLVFNLELQFRGIRPSRNFPVWLEEAHLRAKGSVITHTRFMAIPSPNTNPGGRDGGDHSDASTTTRTKKDNNVEQQYNEAVAIKKGLRTTVGRMLWQEIWGPFVTTGDKWWWEVPEIVDECVERGTYWEYSIIAACKAIA